MDVIVLSTWSLIIYKDPKICWFNNISSFMYCDLENQHDGGYLESLYSFNKIKIIVTYAEGIIVIYRLPLGQ
jgi:hypothetical protein